MNEINKDGLDQQLSDALAEGAKVEAPSDLGSKLKTAIDAEIGAASAVLAAAVAARNFRRVVLIVRLLNLLAGFDAPSFDHFEIGGERRDLLVRQTACDHPHDRVRPCLDLVGMHRAGEILLGPAGIEGMPSSAPSGWWQVTHSPARYSP